MLKTEVSRWMPGLTNCSRYAEVISILQSIDTLTAFGAVAVTAMMLIYSLGERSAAIILALAGACVAASVYGSCEALGHSES